MKTEDKPILLRSKGELISKVSPETDKISYGVQITKTAYNHHSVAYLTNDGTSAYPDDAIFTNKELAETYAKRHTYTIYKENGNQ